MSGIKSERELIASIDQRKTEEHQALTSVLLELTVAASELFNPKSPISNLLERIAERLGCYAVLFFEGKSSKKTSLQLIESIGLSDQSRNHPMILLKPQQDSVQFKCRELVRPDLIFWSFPISIEKEDQTPEAIYYLQLYFQVHFQPHDQYRGMINRLTSTLKNALAHRRLYTHTLENNVELERGEKERADLLKREIKARALAESERKKIEKALNTRDEFISIASHELRTPITSLRLQLQLVKLELDKHLRSYPQTESPIQRMKRMLSISEQQVDRLIQLIFGLLDVSKIQAGKLSIEPSQVNLSTLLATLVNNFSSQFKSSNNEVSLHLEPDVIGYWDPFRIEQVINNLITNAMKYGSSKPIEIILSKTRTYARLTIQDHGIGIKKEQQKQIFRKFERISSSTHVTGLGLGLYIARQIVNHHRGKLCVVSSPGQGSTFTVTLPLRLLSDPSLKKSNHSKARPKRSA